MKTFKGYLLIIGVLMLHSCADYKLLFPGSPGVGGQYARPGTGA